MYLYDARNEYVGIGEFEKNIGMCIAARAKELREKYGVELYFMVGKKQIGSFGGDVKYIKVNNFVKVLVNIDPTHLLCRLVIPKVDLMHLTHQQPKFHRGISRYTLLTIHDINFFHNNLNRSLFNKIRRIKRALRSATHLSFISQFTSKDVKAHFPIKQPNRIIMNGVSDLSQLPISAETEQAFKDRMLPKDFLFHVSGLGEKKNVHLIVEMMKHLPNETLVVAGKGKKKAYERLQKIIDENQLKNVYILGGVNREEKALLFKHCKAFLFPSLSEGFGLPVLEAMCFGKPTIISNRTSLPEVGGDIAYYYDQLEPAVMATVTAASIASFYSSPEENKKRTKQHAASFSWERAADEYIGYYLDILGIAP